MTVSALAALMAAAMATTRPVAGPCSRPAGATTTAATTTTTTATTTGPAPPADPATMAILKRLEAAAEKHPRVAARLDYLVEMLQAGDTERRTGKVYFQAASGSRPAKFRIRFDTLQQSGGPRIRNVVDYVFDGAWLTVRKERIRQQVRYQVAPPGKRADPLKLGKGPFPVPFGQKAEEVLDYFTASTRPPRKTDPPGTDYLRLVTRPGRRRELALRWIEIWVSRQTGLPVKIVAEDRSQNRSTVLFESIRTPEKFPPHTFVLPTPPRGWEVRVEKFRGRVN